MAITKATQGVIDPNICTTDTAQTITGAKSITSTGSTTARTLQDRFADVVNVKDFGAVGDGVADDTAAIQAAINSNAKIIEGSGLTYKVSAVINIPSNKVIQNIKINASGFSSGSTFDSVFNIQGSLGGNIYLTTDANADSVGVSYPGMPTIQVVDASSFFIGDLIQITSDELWSDNLNVGELALITNISGNTITLSAPLFYSYNVSDNGRIRKINTIDNVIFSNVTGVGPFQLNVTPTQYMNFISAYCAKNIFIENCSASLFRINTISFRMSYNCHLKDSSIFDCEGGYGIAIYDSSQNIFVTNNTFNNVRHGVTVNASNTYGGGIPNNIHVIGNNSVGRVEAIDCHLGADNVIFSNNTLRCNSGESSGQGGIMFQGRNLICTNNTINGYSNSALIIQPFVGASKYFPNITVSQNRIYTTTCSSSSTGIYIQNGNGGTIKGNSCESLIISNNAVVGPFSKGVYLYTTNTSTTNLDNFVISNNVLYKCLYGIHIRAGLTKNINFGNISGNNINCFNSVGVSYGIFLQSDALTSINGINIIGNTISNSTGGINFATSGTYAGIKETATLFNNVATPFSNFKTLILSSGAITLQVAFSINTIIDTEGGAATDILDTINGGIIGMEIIINTLNNSRNVTFKNNIGNLRINGDFTSTSTLDIIGLYFNGSYWIEKFRSFNT